MSTEADLRLAIRGFQAQYQEQKDKNAQIEKKIKALEEAKKKMEEARKGVIALRGEITKQKVDSWWNGKLAETTRDYIKTSAPAKTNTLISNIDDSINEINKYINGLRHDYNVIVKILSGLESSINNTKKELSATIQAAQQAVSENWGG